MSDRLFAAHGHRIAYEERGAGGDRTVLVLHGLTGDRHLMLEACDPALERAGMRRLYLDLPGHGHSAGHHGSASADDLVDVLEALIADLGGPRPIVVAYSYGAYLTQGLVRAVPFGGLFFVCPVVEADFGKRTRPPRRVARREPALQFADEEHERATFEEVAVVQSLPVLESYRRLVMPASRVADRAFIDGVRSRYSMARPYMDTLFRLDGAAVPTSIVCGRDDHWVGFEDAVRLVRAIPAASFHVLEDAGHLLPLEQPARFRMLLDDWLMRLPAAKDGAP